MKKTNKHKTHKRNKRYKKHKTKHLYRKQRQIVTFPGSQGLPLFSVPQKNYVQKILINPHKQSGNMIPGLRNM